MLARPIILAVACVAVTGVTSLAHASAASAGVVASANGAGDVNFGDGLRTFSFTATASPTRTSGQAEVDNRARGSRAHIVVGCLAVQGNIAYVGGTIDSSNNPDLVGAPALFAVQDNGQGAAAAPDQITGLFVGDSDCTSPDNQGPLAGSLFAIQQGNVQVH